MSDVLALAEALIARPSITPEDAGCLELIGDRLQAIGFTLERIDCGKVSNLWARRGSAHPLLCFAGHTDVVPTGPREQWSSDPFVPTVRDGVLYGRGAADMKSSVAAFVVAIEHFVKQHAEHSGSIALLLTSDEEGDATDGTVKVVDALAARNERIDYCIVGEPTSDSAFGDTIKNGRRGSLSATLTVRGIQGHIAYPEKVQNPIHQTVPILTQLAGATWDNGNEYFPPTSFQVSNIHGGTGATNVVPGTLEVMFNFRFSTASTVEELQSRVHAMLDRCGLDYEIRWTVGAKPFVTPRGKLADVIADSILEAIGIQTSLSTSGGTSDGRFVASITNEIIEFGPVNASSHKIDEHIRVADLDSLAGIYETVMRRLLS